MKSGARFRFAGEQSSILLLILAAVCGPGVAGAEALRSPWDGAAVKSTTAPFACPTLKHVAPDLVTDGFYRLGDPTHSIIDAVREAAYHRSADGVKGVGLEIVNAADRYRGTGSKAAARCAFDQILSLAREHALAGKMSSNQAYYVQGWVVGAIAVAYLKIREAVPGKPEEQRAIAQWMTSVGAQTRAYYGRHQGAGSEDSGNNHLYWAGLELAAIGVAADRRDDFDWAMGTYDNGVKQIRPDGTLPREMARGQRALHYHLYSLAPLVLLAEFGEANGLDLYAHAGGAIHRLVDVSVAGLLDPTPFSRAAGVPQEKFSSIGLGQIGWATPYLRRFPQPALAKMVAACHDMSVYYLGGLPPA